MMMHEHQAILVPSETSRCACWSASTGGGCLASLAGDSGAFGGLVGGRASGPRPPLPVALAGQPRITAW